MTGPRAVLGVLVLLAAMATGRAAVAETQLNLMVFQGVQNLPLYAAQSKGFFAKRDLAIDLKFAPSSQELRDGLAQGRYHIVHTSVDNAVAMAEQAKIDIVVLLGGDNGWNNMYVQPEIKSYADLRGKTLIVDAVDTAFAFQLYQILKLNGVKPGEYEVKPVGATRFRLEGMQNNKSYAAAMLNLPFSLQAERAGLKTMAVAVDVVGPYLSTTGFVLRAWAKDNGDTLVKYIQAYIDGLRWSLNPANKAEATSMLAERLKLPQDMGEQSYAVATDPKNGLTRDAKMDIEGFKNVLKLRAELHGDWGGVPPAPDRYLDLSFYDRALKGM
jgi:ABC-type nitrate/sulfonate/bicarbonate transport system substrate-binding protein